MKAGKLGVLSIALMYVATIMGAGFASGREIWQFFGVFQGRGIIGIILIGIMTSIIARKLNTNHMGIGIIVLVVVNFMVVMKKKPAAVDPF